MRVSPVVLALAVAPFMPFNLSAQETTRSVRVGVMAGVALADVVDVSFEELVPTGVTTKKRTGAQVGVYMMLPMGNRIAVQPELHYIQKGAAITTNEVNGGVPAGTTLSLKTAYFEVPLLLRLDMADPSASLQPFVVAGPSVAYRSSCELTLESGTASAGTKCGENPDQSEDPFKKVDYSAMAGAGLAANVMGRPASLQVRYSRSLSSITSENSGSDKPKNSVISLLVGFGF